MPLAACVLPRQTGIAGAAGLKHFDRDAITFGYLPSLSGPAAPIVSMIPIVLVAGDEQRNPPASSPVYCSWSVPHSPQSLHADKRVVVADGG